MANRVRLTDADSLHRHKVGEKDTGPSPRFLSTESASSRDASQGDGVCLSLEPSAERNSAFVLPRDGYKSDVYVFAHIPKGGALITLAGFLQMLSVNPFLTVVIVLVLGTIFVNGATDAANAIAESVGTRSISVNAAIAMSVAMNFIGLVAMTAISTAVADTMSGMVDFGGDSHAAMIALAAATVGIVVWGLGAWAFGIPTSESHALIAGLTGAALAVHGGLEGVNMGEWMKVVYGLVLSTLMGFGAGWLFARIIQVACKNANRLAADEAFGKLQVVGSAFVALMHGAQDGQKFMSTAMLAIALSVGPADQGDRRGLKAGTQGKIDIQQIIADGIDGHLERADSSRDAGDHRQRRPHGQIVDDTALCHGQNLTQAVLCHAIAPVKTVWNVQEQVFLPDEHHAEDTFRRVPDEDDIGFLTAGLKRSEGMFMPASKPSPYSYIFMAKDIIL